MKSMTGYGRGECSQRGFKVTVEVSSVNRKQTEIAVNLPRVLEVLEAQLRDEINRRVARGRLTVRVSVHAATGAAGKTLINAALARTYAKELRALAKSLHLAEVVTLDLLTRAPGVMQPAEEITPAEELWPAISKALQTALDVLLKMREREGAWLARDLVARAGRLRAGVRRVGGGGGGGGPRARRNNIGPSCWPASRPPAWPPPPWKTSACSRRFSISPTAPIFRRN
jgi:uncharacterized protein (TIGR00255 family)